MSRFVAGNFFLGNIKRGASVMRNLLDLVFHHFSRFAFRRCALCLFESGGSRCDVSIRYLCKVEYGSVAGKMDAGDSGELYHLHPFAELARRCSKDFYYFGCRDPGKMK